VRSNLDDRALFIRGATYFVLSVGVVFLLAVPCFWKHGRTILAGNASIFWTVLLLVLGVVYTSFFQVTGRLRLPSADARAYGFVAGTLAPVHAVLPCIRPPSVWTGVRSLTSVLPSKPPPKNIDPSVSNVTFLASNIDGDRIGGANCGLLIAVPTFAAVIGWDIGGRLYPYWCPGSRVLLLIGVARSV